MCSPRFRRWLSEHQHRDDVARGYGAALEAVHDHRVDVVTLLGVDQVRVLGLDGAEREVEQVVDEKRQHEQARHDDPARRRASCHRLGALVADGAGGPVRERELEREVDVHAEYAGEPRPSHPKDTSI